MFFDPEKAPRRPADFRIPIAKDDLESGALLMFCQAVLSHPVFVGFTEGQGADLCAVGLGYANQVGVKRLLQHPKAAHLPYLYWELRDFITWNIASAAGLNPARVRAAVSAAIAASDLSVMRCYPYRAMLSRHPNEEKAWTGERRERRLDWDRHLEGLIPHGKRALLPDGRLYLRLYLETQFALVRDFDDSATWDSEETARRALDNACISLSEALTWEPQEARPPGLWPKSFYSPNGQLVGHGYSCAQVRGYLEQVYPADGALFLTAGERLWHRQPVPEGLSQLPVVLFEDEYQNPFVPREVPSAKDPVQEIFDMDVEPRDRDAVPAENGRIRLGRTVVLANCRYSMPNFEFNEERLTAFPGFKLVAASQASADDFAWLLEQQPMLVAPEAVQLLQRLWATLLRLKDKEDAWALEPGSVAAMSELLARTASFGKPVQAQGADAQAQGTGGMVALDMRFYSIPRVKKLYPELTPIRDSAVGDYALDFYGKNGVRHDREPRERSVEFMRYATLRNLGLDVRAGSSQDFYATEPALYRLVRLALAKPRTDITDLADRARSWLKAVYGALAVPDALDTSASELREPSGPRDAHPGIVEYA